MGEMPGEVRVLIIEDDWEMTQLLTEVLQGAGCQVHAARDGVSGIQLFQEHPPDLVVLDLMMPRMDGYETCRRIREFSEVAIIILSGRADETSIVRALDLGADDYITKPFGAR
jgi:DNA-binding response OmpR family regulator